MPKTLMMMRHGKYTSPETCLNETGRGQVDDVATQLADKKLIPDVIIHSPMPRAVETAERVRDVFNRLCGKNIELKVQHNLADKIQSRATDITDLVDDKIETVLVIAHQPNIYFLLQEIYGQAAAPYHAQTYVLESKKPEWSGYRGHVAAEYLPKILSR